MLINSDQEDETVQSYWIMTTAKHCFRFSRILTVTASHQRKVFGTHLSVLNYQKQKTKKKVIKL